MTTDRRSDLRAAYLLAFDNFATVPAEVVAAGITDDAKDARRLLDAMAPLVVSDVVNGAERTWQCAETYDSISRTTAIRRFDKAFPKGQPVEIAEPTKNGRHGATGPRYSAEQISQGIRLTQAGQSAKAVAAAVGVKSPNYFRKVVKAEIAVIEQATKSEKKSRRAAAKAVAAVVNGPSVLAAAREASK
jgi:hypothetical protein